MDERINREIEQCIKHSGESNKIRKAFWYMDEKVENLLFGIRQGDDAIVVKDMVFNMEGPYPLNIGRKTGLIHTTSDIVVMGAKPLYGFDAMQAKNLKEAEDAAEDIKKQSDGINVPIVGGNTQCLKNLESCVSFFVVGKMIKPIPDSNLQENDKIYILGEAIEGEIGDRVKKANTKFETFLDMIEKTEINAAKDCSRGGWFGNLTEMLIKSKKGIIINNIPYTEFSKYMGNYLISTKDEGVIDIAMQHKCPITEIGIVTNDLEVKIGKEVAVDKEKILNLIDKFPFKKPHLKKEKI